MPHVALHPLVVWQNCPGHDPSASLIDAQSFTGHVLYVCAMVYKAVVAVCES